MAIFLTDTGEVALLNKLLKTALSTNENYVLKLFTNNYTPSDGSVQGQFTEAVFTNYTSRTLTRAGWNAAGIVSNKASMSYGSTPRSWTCGATGNTVYGYWVTGDGTNAGTLLWVERFITNRVLANGDILNLTPQFTLNSETFG